MLDALLANQLVRAVAPGAHLLLVGDPDQLPSVGAGDVLGDLLRFAEGPTAGRGPAGRFPVTRLQHIFRQGPGSGIALNARRINAGETPRFGAEVQDCFFVPAETGGGRRRGRRRPGRPAPAGPLRLPPGGGAGALPDAPRRGRRRRAQRPAAGAPQPGPAGAPRGCAGPGAPTARATASCS